MVARAAVTGLYTLTKPALFTAFPVVRRAAIVASAQKYLHGSSRLQNISSGSPTSSKSGLAASVEQPNAPTEDDARNAAFLGEADSDDGFEASVETHPEAYRHQFSDVAASGLHGQAGEGDEPIEREMRPLEALDATHSAYLGEADSDDAHEADREANPEKHRHKIEDAGSSGMHGEAGDDPVEEHR